MYFLKIPLRNVAFFFLFSLIINHSKTISTDLEPDIFIKTLLKHQEHDNKIIFLIDSSRTTSSEIFHEKLVFVELAARIIMKSSVNTTISLVILSSKSSINSNHSKSSYWNNNLCSFLSVLWNITYRDDDYFASNANMGLETIQSLFNGSNSNSCKVMILLSEYQNNEESETRRLTTELRKMGVIIFTLRLSDKNSYNNTYSTTNGVQYIKEINRKLKEAICCQRPCTDPQYRLCNPCLFTLYNSQIPQKGSFCQSFENQTKSKRQISTKTCRDTVCLNGGTCIQGIGKLVCKCPMNFFGEKCEKTLNPIGCVSNPCKNGAVCFDREKGFKCCCPKGYAGRFCQRKELPCDSKKCFNGGICTIAPQGILCRCPLGFEGERCEINLEFQIDFQAEFSGYTSQYIKLHNKRHLSAVTIAFWMKSNVKKLNNRGTPFSYSYRDPYTNKVEENALTLVYTNKFHLYLHGNRIITNIVGNSDNEWHHCAITWESKTGDWAIYWDGRLEIKGTKVSIGKRLWSGYFVIGQEQDSLGAAFSQQESYKGSISQFNVWDHAISMKNIQLLRRSCGLSGNVFSWGDIRARKGEGRLSSLVKTTDLCSAIGMCSEKDCYCNRASLLRSQQCWRNLDLSNCNPNPCANKQSCIKKSGSPQCRCNKGFEGILCEYDIDECLMNKGNCSENCNNLNGSYNCSCMGAKRLASDKHKCVETAHCYHKPAEDVYIYDDGYTWEESCKECKCDRGEVICNAKQCPKNRCRPNEKEILLPNTCCKKCAIDVSHCNHNGRIYMNKDKWSSGCGNCSCNNGEVRCVMLPCPVLSCKQNEINVLLPWKCCRQCIEKKSFCKFHRNEINTFDGLKYPFTGRCRYVLVADCKDEEISIQHEVSPYNLQEETLIIHYKCTEVKIHSMGIALIENEKVELPYKDNRFIYINASSGRDNVKMSIHMINGMWIRWESPGKIEIWSPSKYNGRLCGLCGNFNGRRDDDQQDPLMTPTVTMDSSYEPLNLCQNHATSLSADTTSTYSPSHPQVTTVDSSGVTKIRKPSATYPGIMAKGATPLFITDIVLICALSAFIWQHFVCI